MKRLVALLGLVAVLAVGVQQAVGRTAAGRAVLRVAGTEPFSVRGIGFRPGEHVTLVATAAARSVARPVASARGVFVVTFPHMNPDSCRGYAVTATGNLGSRAVLKQAPGRCQPPPVAP